MDKEIISSEKENEKEKQKQTVFNVVFSYIVDTYSVKPKRICDNYRFENEKGEVFTVTEATVSSWKSRSAPPDTTKDFALNAIEKSIVEVLEYSPKTQEKFSSDMKIIYASFGLLQVYNNIISSPRTYIDLIMSFLKAAYVGAQDMHKKDNVTIVSHVEQKAITKVVVFDLDGTLIKGIKYSWPILYQAVNVPKEACKAKKHEFEEGLISYPEWVDYDCNQLRQNGLTRGMAQEIVKEKCSLTKNFRKAIQRLKDNGCAVGIISGGADTVLYSLIPDADELFDNNIYINRLKFDDKGTLIDIEPTPYDWDDDGKLRGVQGKNVGLQKICKKYGVPLENATFVGDDDNDFKAMRLAGTRILYQSFDPNDKTYGTGSREIPSGIKIVTQNDLMLVADIILGEEIL